MSEQAPEPQRGPPPGKKENVLTRKLGPLPTWVWVVIVAAVILLYFVWKGRSGSTAQGASTGTATGTGPGSMLIRIIQPGRNRPPHTRHHRRGDHDEDEDEDRKRAKDHDRERRVRSPGNKPAGAPPESDVPVGVDRRDKRGSPPPGQLVSFKTAEAGDTPSLQDVSNHYGTSPEAIVMEAEGRGYPTSVAWKRYVSRHDWASPLPPATDFAILAHPG